MLDDLSKMRAYLRDECFGTEKNKGRELGRRCAGEGFKEDIESLQREGRERDVCSEQQGRWRGIAGHDGLGWFERQQDIENEEIGREEKTAKEEAE